MLGLERVAEQVTAEPTAAGEGQAKLLRIARAAGGSVAEPAAIPDTPKKAAAKKAIADKAAAVKAAANRPAAEQAPAKKK